MTSHEMLAGAIAAAFLAPAAVLWSAYCAARAARYLRELRRGSSR